MLQVFDVSRKSLLKQLLTVCMDSLFSQYDTDFYVLDKYPLAVRPFYTMPDPTNPVSLSLTHPCIQCTHLVAP